VKLQLIWFIEFIVVAAMISKSWSYQVIDKEREMAVQFLGEKWLSASCWSVDIFR
jgi:hypothetical protein